MGQVNKTRYVDLRIVDINNNPVPGRLLTDWDIIFTRTNVACLDPLSLLDHADGRYTVSYTPSAEGHDYLDIYDPVHDLRTVDIEEIESSPNSAAVEVDQDFGGADALQVTEANPDSYLLLVFRSSEWVNGLRDDSQALGSTALDAEGRWVNSLFLLPDTYHIVVRKPLISKVVWPYLVIA